ncbi:MULTISPECIES: polysaccharide biosynthesis/export family protein [unclassified Microcoleus]|uniref:polysaccharide biosynthesis/export family protein n=1 Tax=unclassified Microcoleus TaxID=2642155 RepID=UPI001D29E5A1|nr:MULTISPECIES: SLBB domain-containing protein [unclassified Microcoleus]MCC3443842.1 SLBB domain-containing protein [Microcoleus sp. PH2017_03_ELD_O_A]MCC3471166.1 SLBB domain-containing protein [Microcoleus sp. PH2017_13_LAR_U_A]MCC3503474.1 SLBB domain-containing protein [Microcoleus sp. PH2017_19_SFW_U_A]TAG96913.1 MAG: polysaccharide export protein [Oscillatoriales cyanobacterium]MCC3483822.1 SLBB domain-containing protein [Microcoleus sp. PH2017_14_LAR_D_A]
MVVNSSSRGAQLEKKPHPAVVLAKRKRGDFLPYLCRKGSEGEVFSTICKQVYGVSNAVKNLIFQSLTVSVLAATVGSSVAVAQFLPPPPPSPPSPPPSPSYPPPSPSYPLPPPPASGSGSPIRVPVPAAPGFPSVPASAPSSVRSEVYTLGAGDRIQMDIFNVPEYSGPNGQHQVQADGSLSLPLIGSLGVAGMTLEQASNAVKERYGKYLKRPWITLKLLAARPLQIAIAGEINRPGAYTISSAAGPGGTSEQIGTQMPTISRALRLAGGITQSADVRQIKIRRPQRNAAEQIISVDLWELLQNGDLRADMTLRDGDTIFIPTVTSLNRQEAPTLAVANITGQSTQPINIAVVGEVTRPGTYTLAKELQSRLQENESGADSGLFAAKETPGGGENVLQQTVTRAIKMAGGITPVADIRQIQVRRLTRAGTEQIINVNLWQLLEAGDVSQDLTLQQGDTVIVPKAENLNALEGAQVATSNFSPDSIKVSLVGEIVKPGSFALQPNTTLNQALVAAGGFNKSRAEMDSVDLIRLNPNGTVSRLSVKVNFSATANEESNPKLQNNDVIMVRRSGRAAFSDNVGGTLAPFSPLLGIFRLFNIFR